MKFPRVKECIGYWMQHNEKAWQRRCLGKTHEGNVLKISLTPEQIKSLDFFNDEDDKLIYCKGQSLPGNSLLDETDLDVLTKTANFGQDLLLVSVGTNDVDDNLTPAEDIHTLVDEQAPDSDGRISIRFMQEYHALFAYPEYVIRYDLEHVLRFMLEKRIIEPSILLMSPREDGGRQESTLLHKALLQHIVSHHSTDCYPYLLSYHGTDINAVSRNVPVAQGVTFCWNILNFCLTYEWIPASYLKALIAHPNVNLDACDSDGETSICMGCRVEDIGDQTITKIRLLLEAGADPRIGDDDGHTPLSNLRSTITEAAVDGQKEGLKELLLLRAKILERIQELNNADGQNI